MASSIASLVPEPIEKCAVWAASPTSTTLSWCQRSLRTVGKLRQIERFVSSGCPRARRAKSRSRERDRVVLGRPASSPALRHVSSVDSTMKVELAVVEPVGVHLEQAVRVLLEEERERGERRTSSRARRTGSAASRSAGRKCSRVARAHRAVHAVGREDQVGVARTARGRRPRALNRAARRARAQRSLQDVEQRLPRQAREAVPGRGTISPLIVDLDVVPVGERAADRLVGLAVGLREALQRRVGEDHAPAEGVVRAVALEDGDLVRGVGLLHEEREVQARGPPPMQTIFTAAPPWPSPLASKAIVGRKRGPSNRAPLPLR